MKKSWLLLLVLVSAGTPAKWDFSIDLIDTKAAIGTKEDPLARQNYERMLLADPSTGEIPNQIRSRELAFLTVLQQSPTYRSAASKRKKNETWELAGPFNVGGRTRALALDVQNENTILAGGVSGGMWKSDNGGTTWRRVTDPQIHNSISCIAQDTRAGKENTWYFGTGELVGNSARSIGAPYRGDGIFKSTDNGESWTQLPATKDAASDLFGSQFQYSWNLVVNNHRADQNEVFVAAIGGILKSSDGGTSWENVLGPRFIGLNPKVDLNDSLMAYFTNIIQTPHGHFYATLSTATGRVDRFGNDVVTPDGGFYFSETGENWIDITPSLLPDYFERTVMSFSESEPNVILFFTRGASEEELFLHQYTRTGLSGGIPTGTWTDLSDNIPQFGGDVGDFDTQSGYNMVIALHPQNRDIVYLGGTNLYRSTSGFRNESTTKWIGGYHPDNSTGVYPGHHPDQHTVVFYPSDPDKLLSACDGGVRLSQDATADSVFWTSLNNGYVTAQFYSISQQQDQANNLTIGGMQDNGSYIRAAPGENPSWVRLLGGDGGFSAISRNKSFVYVSFQESQIYRLTTNSANQLTSFARVDPIDGGEQEGQSYLFINPYTLDPANTNRMFLLGGNEIWRNENLAQIPGASQKKTSVNWSRIADTDVNFGIYTAISKHFQEDVVYAALYNNTDAEARFPRLVRIDNASVPDLEEVTFFDHSAHFPNGGYPASVRSNPENAAEIMIAFSNYSVPSLFHSADGGTTVTDVSGNLESFPDGEGDGPSVRWCEIVPTSSGTRYFAGTSIGLFSTEALNGSETVWIQEGVETIGKAVIVMMDYRPLDGRLVIASHGNGIFQAYIEDWKLIQNGSITTELVVKNAYPNPFSDKTYLQYALPDDGVVKIDLYDRGGKLIKNLLYGPQFAGENTVIWDGTNVAGVPVVGGLYFCTLSFGGKAKTRRVVYMP